jgi:perosamine synthetase
MKVIGYNFRLTNIQAEISVAQLEKLDEIVNKKNYIGKYYNELLRNHKLVSQIPERHNDIKNSYWMFSFLLKRKKTNREQIMKMLLEQGIETRPVFYPLH